MISLFHATYIPRLGRLKILNPQTEKDSAEWRDVAEAMRIGSEHAYILQQDSLEPFGSTTPCNYGHSLPIFCLFPNAPWRLAAVCTSWPFGWSPLLLRRLLPRTGTVTAYVSSTLATADLYQCVFQCGIRCSVLWCCLCRCSTKSYVIHVTVYTLDNWTNFMDRA